MNTQQVEQSDIFTEPELTQEDMDAVRKMFALVEKDEDSADDPVRSDEQLIRNFCDGTGVFAD